METEDHREEPTEDSLMEFIGGDRDIFVDDPVTNSQLKRVVEASTLGDLAVPSRIQRLL